MEDLSHQPHAVSMQHFSISVAVVSLTSLVLAVLFLHQAETKNMQHQC